MPLNCLTNICGDIHFAIPAVVMFEILPATILTFHEYQSLCVFGRNFILSFILWYSF